MASDELLRAVRRQVRLGRLVPLGAPEDGAWLAERAAAHALRRAVAAAVPDVRVDELRVALADVPPERPLPPEPLPPPPPSGLPPGPLRIEATCSAGVARPLPDSAREARAALAAAARDRLGLAVTAIDVHVAGLLADWPGAEPEQPPEETAATVAGDGGPVAGAVLAVPGVLGLSGALGGPAHALRVIDAPEGGPPGRLVRLQLVVDAGHHTLTVVRQARAAAARAAMGGAPGPVTVTVVVTGLAPLPPSRPADLRPGG